MPESVTYYHRDGKDYAVFAYDLDTLHVLLAYLEEVQNFATLIDPTLQSYDDMRHDVNVAIAHLAMRKGGSGAEDSNAL